MKEWDYNAYQRKFHNTFARIVSRVKKEVREGFVASVGEETFFLIEGPTVMGREYSYEDWDLTYSYFPSGWVGPFTMFVRRQKQVFSVGYCNNSHRLVNYNLTKKCFVDVSPGLSDAWFLPFKAPPAGPRPFDEIELALDLAGAISNRLFLGIDKVHYYDITIGKREGRKITLYNEAVAQELTDVLRGHEWHLT